MKRIFLFLTSASVSFTGFSQSLSEAVVKTMNERYEAAAEDFQVLLKAGSTNGDYYFYEGDNYLNWGELDNARASFSKGVEAAPSNPLNFVGLGKQSLLKGDKSGAQLHFTKAVELMTAKGSKVDKVTQQSAYLEMAEAQITGNGKNLTDALNSLTAAQKLNDKNPELYIQFGDYYAEKDGINLSNALAQYNKALELNPKYTRALLRQGQLYVNVRNWDEALKYFNQAIETDPTFAPAYREKAELLYRAGRYNPAIDSYARYLELNNSCRVQQRYASFIYLTKEYRKAADEIEKAIPCNPDNLIMFRVLGYAYYELGENDKALANLDKYFAMAEAKDRSIITGTDLAYRGKVLAKMGQDSLGIELIKQALDMDTSYKDGYGEIATLYSKAKNYPKAVEWFEKKIVATGERNPLDLYYLGQSAYYAKDYVKSDSAFAEVTTKYPDAWFWRARCNNKQDNQEMPAGLAKPFYETAIRKNGVEPKSIEANKKSLIEAYSYLGLFYGKQDNYECSKAAWNKVLELDPTNKVATDVMQDKNLISAGGMCELIPVQ